MATGKVVSVRLEAQVQGFTAGMRSAKKSVDDLTSAGKVSKQQAFDDLADKGAVAGAAIAAGIGVAIKRFADFDKAMSAVAANSGATGQDLERLREIAVELGSDTVFSATEAAEGINELAKAGVNTADIMGGGLKGSLDLAAAGQIGVGEAAELAASAMTQFNLDGSQVPHIADLMANAANKAQGGVGDMGQALQQAGLVAAATGLTIEETTAGLTAFASAGLTGSDAGTSFKTMLQRLSAPTGEAASLMEELGISAYDSQGNFVGLAEVAGQLETSMSDLTPAQRNAAMATIFGADAVRAANILYSEGADGISKWTSEVSESGAASEMAAKLTDNLSGDIERLGGAFDEVFLSTGGSANGALRTIVQGLEGLVTIVGRVPGPVLLAAGALSSLALVGPKAISGFREYRNNLDTLGLSMGKIEQKAPRAAKALRGVGLAASGLAMYGTALAVFGDDLGSIGSEQLVRDLNNTGDALRSIDDAIAQADGGASDIQDLGKALQVSFDPNFIDKIGAGLDGFFSIFGAEKTGEIAVSEKRLAELDSTMAGMVSSGNAEGAAQMMSAIEKAAKQQGISVEDLKDKFPLLAEAYAAAENSGDGMTTAMQEQEEAAAAAEQAIDDLRTALEMMGGGFRAEQAASRAVTESLQEMQAVVKEGKGGWSELSASMEQSAADALAFAGTQVEMGRSSDVIAAGLSRAREQVIQSGVDAGKSRPFMEAYADSIGLIPSEAKTMIEAAGAGKATAEVLALDESIMLLNGKTVTVKEAGALASQGRVKGMKYEITTAKGKTVKVTEIGATAAGDRVVLMNGKIRVLKGKTVNVDERGATASKGRVDNMRGSIQATKGKTVDVSVRTYGQSALANLQSQINRMSGRDIYVNTWMTTHRKTVDMGTWKARALGGIDEHRTIAMAAGDLRSAVAPGVYGTSPQGILMAEDTRSAWEAYIPERMDLRPRAEAILAETARRFGKQVIPMAEGGMRDYRAYNTAAPSVTVQAPSSAPVTVDASGIEAAVGAALSGWRPMVELNGRQIHGVMQRVNTERKGR